MAQKGDWAYLGNGKEIFVPEKRITADDPSYRYLPLRGYSHTMAVQYGDKVIGWIEIGDLGYPDVKAYVNSLGALNAAERRRAGAREGVTDEKLRHAIGSLAHNQRFSGAMLKQYLRADASALLRRLVKQGYVERHGRTYFPTDKGWAWIEGNG